ncbi:MAG: SLC13 family permease [Gammaproteobacteria bacterium]
MALLSQPVLFSAILLGCLLLLFSGRYQPHQAMSIAALCAVLLGLVPVAELTSALANPSLWSVVMLVLFTSVILRSTIGFTLISYLQNISHSSFSLLRLAVVTGFVSAFLNNTAVVSMFLAAMEKNPARRYFLLPLCYAAILGGTLTLVGTSTHLLANGILSELNRPVLSFFDFFPVGIALFVLGLPALLLASYWLRRRYPSGEIDQTSNNEAIWNTEALLVPDSPLVGKSVLKAGLRNLGLHYLVAIERQGQLIMPASPNTVLQAGDKLQFVGDLLMTQSLIERGLVVAEQVRQPSMDLEIQRAVLHSHSSLIGTTLKEADFRNSHDAAVIGVSRGNQSLSGALGQIVLQAGDMLALVAGEKFDRLSRYSSDFHLLARTRVQPVLNVGAAGFLALAFVLVLALVATGQVGLFAGLVTLIALVALTGRLDIARVRRLLPLEMILTIASSLVLAKAFILTGTGMLLASAVAGYLSWLTPWGLMALLYGLTLLTTELLMNNAAVSLMLPLALVVAEATGIHAMPLVMAVIYGASASFLMPHSYQTNLLVYSAGGYEVMDFVRSGLLLTVIYSLVVLIGVPFWFPF